MNINKNKGIRDWIIFINVVESGSFSLAAKKLGISISMVSKTIFKLEQNVNALLLRRDTRKMEVTESGKVAYEKAKEITALYYSLLEEVKYPSEILKGNISLSATAFICENFGGTWALEYMQKNKNSKILLKSREGFFSNAYSPDFNDLAIKSGFIEGSGLVHHKINPMKMVIVASPDYIKRHGEIYHPNDLQDHVIMKLNHPKIAYPIPLSYNESTLNLDCSTSTGLTSENIGSILQLTLEGKGVCIALPKFLIDKHLECGDLKTIINKWNIPKIPMNLVYRQRKRYSPLFKDFRDFIEEKWNNHNVRKVFPDEEKTE
ncbi:LysR family transcriptional regulator [Serratia ureilytica]|uniref:LysR family transcriptional regulator n=1 Tax=Serratia ureilytica TaxID=300181 RepID=UPI003F6BBA7A